MKIILIASSIILPFIMIYIHHHWIKSWIYFNLVMVLSVIIFGNIAAISVYQIIRDNEVFMTAIHAVFLNPLFLITGAYIVIYSIYRLMLLVKKEIYFIN